MMSKRVLVPEDWRPSLFRNLSAGDSSNRRSLVGILTDASKRLPFLHVVSVEDFCGTTVENLMVLAKHFQFLSEKNVQVGDPLSGKIMITLIYGDDSSCTGAALYDAAMKRLGGSVIAVNPSSSSVQKGESLSDTVKILASYADIMVVKQAEVEASSVASWCGLKPFISAGDPTEENLVQALSDVFTIWNEFGTLKDLTVTFTGSLTQGSASYSLVKLLVLYPISEIRYVATVGFEIPDSIREYVEERNIKQVTYASLAEALPGTNVLYIGAFCQKNFDDENQYMSAISTSTLSPSVMNSLPPETQLSSSKLRILHLPPHLSSKLISSELDKDPRVMCSKQVENGFYLRQALLYTLLGGRPEEYRSAPVSLDTFRRRKSWTPVFRGKH